MLAFGYLPRSELQAVFGNPAPVTIGAMFVLSAALVRTGVIEALASIARGAPSAHPNVRSPSFLAVPFSLRRS